MWIVYVLIVLSGFWLGLLVVSLWGHVRYFMQIRRCKDVSELRVPDNDLHVTADSSLAETESPEEVFRSFQITKRLPQKSPISRHLRALFEAGRHESQLDARGLIKNTSDELFRINTLHRSLLSIFIILGLLGTLFGLADTMSALDELLRGTSQLNNDTLSLSLQQLLGTLKGAFAPSILGVSLTVLGVLLFAFYLRVVALPLSGLLERMTLTVWIPQLVPTPSQKIRERLQLSRQQMERSVEAAKQVTEFADDIQSKTGSLRETLGLTTEAFQQMSQVADRLGTFSRHFEAGVKALVPFQSDLQTLYQQMRDESRVFQESVQRNIAGSEDFQQRIQAQLNSQHDQLVRVMGALEMYEAAYLNSRKEIDKKLEEVLEQAKHAFESLGHRNEEISHTLENALGKPLRENLAVGLGGVQVELQKQLGEITNSLQVQLGSLGERLRQLDAPLNTAAEKFTDTFSNFEGTTREWLTKLQLGFVQQNEINQQQLQRLESLSQQIPQLLKQLTSSSNNFSESSSSFATHGQQLSQNTDTLSQSIAALGRGVDALNEQVSRQPSGDDRAAELLSQQTALSQELTETIESLRGRR
jgi:methyl-accepting chemotaxis protein